MSILISLCHTTARLPDGWREAAQAWFDNCDNPEIIEHIFTVDEDSIQSLGDFKQIFPNTVLGINTGPKSCVAGWNAAYAQSHGKFIISLADDWFPCPHWDTELLKRIPDLNKPYVLDVDIAGNPELLAFVMATRSFLDQYNGGAGWMFYPEYDGIYCDNDFTDSARMARSIIDARDLKFPHRQPAYMEGIKADAIHLKQNRREAYEIGIRVYKQRCKAKGLIVQPIIAVCLPGETFHSTWVAYWTSLLTYLGKHFTVSPLFTFSSNVHITRSCMARQILKSYPMPDYVLWIDDDNLLTVEHFDMLLKDLEATPEADMVAAWAWVRPDVYDGDDARTSVGLFDENGVGLRLSLPELMAGPFDVQEIHYSGFPVVLMRGELLEKAGENPFAPIVNPAFEYGFESEDVSFCIHARDRGARLFVDRRVRVPHLKLHDAVPNALAPDPVKKFAPAKVAATK